MVWWALTPPATVRKRAGGVFATGPSAEAAVAADGWFAVCALVAGVVTALVAAIATTRAGGWGILAGLTVGGLLAAALAWQLGVLLGPPALLDGAAEVQEGERFEGPLRLSAVGVVLAWPLAAVMAYFAAIAGREPAHRPSDADGTQVSSGSPGLG